MLRDRVGVNAWTLRARFCCVFRLVGAFVTFSPEFCFVVEDDDGVIGYALAALNAKQFYQKVKTAWIPEMRTKYPENLADVNESAITVARVSIRSTQRKC